MLSAGAQLLIKHGVSDVNGDTARLLATLWSWPLLAGVGLYLLAFLLYAYLLSVFEISYASPLMVAGVTLLIFVAGAYLGEGVGIVRIAGALLLVAGVFLISLSA